MAMYQLSRKTDIVRHHHPCTMLIPPEIGWIRQADLYITGSEESMPERIFLVHIQASGDTDDLFRNCNLHTAVKQKFFFLSINIQTFSITALPIRENFLTSVSRIVTFTAFELITNDQTAVITTFTIQRTCRILSFIYNLIQ